LGLDVVQHPLQEEPVVSAESAGQGFTQVRDLGPRPALGQLGQHCAVALAGDQCPHHGPTGDAHHIGGVGRQLDPGVLEHFVDPVDLRGLLVDQCFAVPGQVT
jgi:hypothetical protein